MTERSIQRCHASTISASFL